jgi:hypothetical protein
MTNIRINGINPAKPPAPSPPAPPVPNAYAVSNKINPPFGYWLIVECFGNYRI